MIFNCRTVMTLKKQSILVKLITGIRGCILAVLGGENKVGRLILLPTKWGYISYAKATLSFLQQSFTMLQALIFFIFQLLESIVHLSFQLLKT
jgi:hypothetical protein